MYKPVNSSSGTLKWGLYPLQQKSKQLSNGDTIESSMSGFLLKGGGDITISIGSRMEGASFAFDAKGGNLTVNLPAGEVTTTGDSAVVVTKVASLTRTNGEWTYAGQ